MATSFALCVHFVVGGGTCAALRTGALPWKREAKGREDVRTRYSGMGGEGSPVPVKDTLKRRREDESEAHAEERPEQRQEQRQQPPQQVRRGHEDGGRDDEVPSSSDVGPPAGPAAALCASAVMAGGWRRPWKLYRVILGHEGWVRCVGVDLGSNEWFATGGGEGAVRVWDLASGRAKAVLRGHVSGVSCVGIDPRRPYLYSGSDDKTAKGWDLETGRAVRSYEGHGKAVTCCALHPALDLLVTGSRDRCVKVWDARSARAVATLVGHTSAVESVLAAGVDPQVISGGADTTVRLWDLAAGREMGDPLVRHRRGVRCLVKSPEGLDVEEHGMVSGAADGIRFWGLPEGVHLRKAFCGRGAGEVVEPGTTLNALAASDEGVLVGGASDGQLSFFDWASGACFQRLHSRPQPGSLEAEACILAAAFDASGARLITCEADKTVKMWKEDARATPETHPGLADWADGGGAGTGGGEHGGARGD